MVATVVRALSHSARFMAAPGLPVYDQYMEYEEPVFQLLAAEGVLMESVDAGMVQEYEPIAAE